MSETERKHILLDWNYHGYQVNIEFTAEVSNEGIVSLGIKSLGDTTTVIGSGETGAVTIEGVKCSEAINPRGHHTEAINARWHHTEALNPTHVLSSEAPNVTVLEFNTEANNRSAPDQEPARITIRLSCPAATSSHEAGTKNSVDKKEHSKMQRASSHQKCKVSHDMQHELEVRNSVTGLGRAKNTTTSKRKERPNSYPAKSNARFTQKRPPYNLPSRQRKVGDQHPVRSPLECTTTSSSICLEVEDLSDEIIEIPVVECEVFKPLNFCITDSIRSISSCEGMPMEVHNFPAFTFSRIGDYSVSATKISDIPSDSGLERTESDLLSEDEDDDSTFTEARECISNSEEELTIIDNDLKNTCCIVHQGAYPDHKIETRYKDLIDTIETSLIRSRFPATDSPEQSDRKLKLPGLKQETPKSFDRFYHLLSILTFYHASPY